MNSDILRPATDCARLLCFRYEHEVKVPPRGSSDYVSVREEGSFGRSVLLSGAHQKHKTVDFILVDAPGQTYVLLISTDIISSS